VPQKARSKNRAERVLRWIARALGSALAATWLLIGVTSAYAGDEPFTLESLGITVYSSLAIAGALIAWRRERPGGSVLFLGGLAFGGFAYCTAGRNMAFAALFTGGPMVSSGRLFLAASRLAAARVDEAS
jgi:hypothetical protein